MLKKWSLLIVLALLASSGVAHAEAAGKPMKVLIFWGSWCSNCPAVMRDMEKLRKSYQGRNVEFVAVSLDDESAPKKYLATRGYGFRVKTGGSALLERYQAVGVPWVVVTDAAGKVIANPSLTSAAKDVPASVKLELDLRT